MLLENNDIKVIKLLDNFDNLTNIDKLRLCINILEKEEFELNEAKNIINNILTNIDNEYKNNIINFNKYKHLLVLSAQYLELDNNQKKHFIIEMLFNIYNTDFNKNINKFINNNLYVFDYYYQLFN